MIRVCLLICLLTGAATAQEDRALFGTDGAAVIRMRSTTDIAVLRDALTAFVARNPDIAIDYEQWGSNDLYDLTRADCEAGTPRADAVLSSAVHHMVELVNMACASPYTSALTAQLPRQRRWRDELWGITREAAVIIYNSDLVPPSEVPRSRFELLDLMRRDADRYRGRIATYDIEASGLGYLFAFADSLEASTFGSMLEGFARAEAVATCCSAEIIAGVQSGRYLIAYNVLGSYVDATRYASVGVVRPRDYTLYLSRTYMIPRGSAARAAAGRLLDFLLSPEGQVILARSGLVEQRDEEAADSTIGTERAIPIEPTLLVARDRQKRARFIARWRTAFGG